MKDSQNREKSSSYTNYKLWIQFTRVHNVHIIVVSWLFDESDLQVKTTIITGSLKRNLVAGVSFCNNATFYLSCQVYLIAYMKRTLISEHLHTIQYLFCVNTLTTASNLTPYIPSLSTLINIQQLLLNYLLG